MYAHWTIVWNLNKRYKKKQSVLGLLMRGKRPGLE